MCFEQIFHYFSKFIFSFTASPLEPYQQGRSTSASLIPFPRVGRSVSEPLQSIDSDQNDDMLSQRSSRSASKSQFYGQKRTGKSSLIPFPRVGRRSDPLWQKSIPRGTPSNKKSNLFIYKPCVFIGVHLTKCTYKKTQDFATYLYHIFFKFATVELVPSAEN